MLLPVMVGNRAPCPEVTVSDVDDVVIDDASVAAALFVNKIVMFYPKVTVFSAAPLMPLAVRGGFGILIVVKSVVITDTALTVKNLCV